MIHGRVVSTTWGRENRISIEVDNAGEDVRQFQAGQRVVIAAIPDDVEIQRAYERGRREAREEEHRAMEAYVNGRRGW